ncbi:MAG: hypothetical protein BGP04_19530 [Rhizobiales bacterium 62-17]|nr:FkbM family methyltransferase [Hyphomicrobiales bacterium]OJX99857.1 MAG: hypothetical protein BGP04_19530 [Rhizobiales bacterium 62-17]
MQYRVGFATCSPVTFFSNAQNFEDVILWRALKHVERGFFIDIGAQDPVIDSVSIAFHHQGWRGVHVEPTPHYAEKLRLYRQGDVVIQAAIGTREGTIPFWEIPGTGLSTGDPAIAAEHARNNHECLQIEVPCMPLSQVLDAYADRPIHWLKIDVEGREDDVIDSWRPSPVRPWIVVVESTKPNTQEPSYANWEPKLIALGYEFAYFDGVNRFYVSQEHIELKAPFGPGPNFFDFFQLDEHSHFNFELAKKLSVVDAAKAKTAALDAALHSHMFGSSRAITHAELPEVLHQLEGGVVQLIKRDTANVALLRQKEADIKAILRQKEVEIKYALDALHAVHSSFSWRITAPLRWIASGPRQMLRDTMSRLLSLKGSSQSSSSKARSVKPMSPTAEPGSPTRPLSLPARQIFNDLNDHE